MWRAVRKPGDTGRYGAVLREETPHVASEPPGSYAEQAGRTPGLSLRVGRYKVSLHLTLALAIVTAAGGYFGSQARHESGADTPAMRAEIQAALDKQAGVAELRAAQLDHRLDVLETNLSLVRGSIDSLRDRLNDKH